MTQAEWEKLLCIDCEKPMVEDYPIRPKNSLCIRCKACQRKHRLEQQAIIRHKEHEENRTAKAVVEMPCFNARLIGRLPAPKVQALMDRWTRGEIIFV